MYNLHVNMTFCVVLKNVVTNIRFSWKNRKKTSVICCRSVLPFLCTKLFKKTFLDNGNYMLIVVFNFFLNTVLCVKNI